MTQHIKINGVDYPIKYSLGTIQRLSKKGITLEEAFKKGGDEDFSQFAEVLFEALQTGCRIENIEHQFNSETFIDHLSIEDVPAYMVALTNCLPKPTEETEAANPNAKKPSKKK